MQTCIPSGPQMGPSILKVLSRITGDLAGRAEMLGLLDQVVNTTMETLNAEVCSIFLVEPENGEEVVVMRAGSGFAKRVVEKAIYKMGEGLTGHIAQSMKSYTFTSRADLQSREENGKRLWRGKHDGMQWPEGESQFRNGIFLPLKIKDRCLGVIKVENKRPESACFSEDDERYIETIANVVALAIENAKLHKRTHEVLLSIAGSLQGQLGMAELLNRVVHTSMDILKAEVCSIFLVESDGEKDYVIMRAGSGFASSVVDKARYEMGEGLTGHIAQTMKGYTFTSRDDLQSREENGKRLWCGKHDGMQWPGGESQFRNGIFLPLKIKERCLGVIKVENKRPENVCFSEQDELYLNTIASVVALEIENARLYERIEKQLNSIKKAAAGAAHSIGNMAANYDGIALLLEEIFNENKLQSNAGLLERLCSATQCLKRLTDEFKRYSKPLELNYTLTNLNKLVQKEVDLVQNSKRNNLNILFIPLLDDKIPMLELDEKKLEEAIQELLLNAIKAVSKRLNAGSKDPEPGEIKVITQHVVREIHPGKGGKLEVIKISVIDNGGGFESDLEPFAPFRTTDPDSTGLGLARVKEIVEAHKGRINILPLERCGAHVEISLPLSM